MDRDALYYHFANLGLVLIGLISIQSILSPFALMILLPGTIAGFILSWRIRNSRPQHMDTFTGMLSLAAAVIILGRFYDSAITFENVMNIFSTALVWLTLFQSFGLKTGRSYAILQFIAVCLFVSSVGLALEQESYYITLLAAFLFIFIFTVRLNLVCEKKRKGSTIIGDQEKVMSLWQQIKVGALMFSFVLIVAGMVYPFVPRFENLSLKWIPSSLLGLSDNIPMLKLLPSAPQTIEKDILSKEDRYVDEIRQRETSGVEIKEEDIKTKTSEEQEKKRERRDEDRQKKSEQKKETTERFRAKDFNDNVDIFKIESLTISSNKQEMSLDSKCKLTAEIKMNDGSTIPATRLVDWKVTGTARVSMDSYGNLTPKEGGYVQVTATYLGTFSNDVRIEVTEPVKPVKKKSWLHYLFVILLWLAILCLLAAFVLVFIRSRKLSELAIKNPREFIKEIYVSLCRGFRPYGVHRFDYIAPREFSVLTTQLIPSAPESMTIMTENVLEARFSAHKIAKEHSYKTLGTFHRVKDVVLQRQEGKHFWKKILFRLVLLDVIMIGNPATRR